MISRLQYNYTPLHTCNLKSAYQNPYLKICIFAHLILSDIKTVSLQKFNALLKHEDIINL